MASNVSESLDTRLSLRLLGGFALERDGRRCDPAYEKGRALLAYLALHPVREQSRTELAGLFWPDLGRDAGLANLRQVLHDLRQKLNAATPGVAPLTVGRHAIRLEPAARLEIDAADFTVPAPVCSAAPPPNECAACLARMENLAVLYRGDFLAGFGLPGCPDFLEWMQAQREALRLRMLQLLARLSDCHERTGMYARALPFAQRFLEMEPWNEEGLRRAMRLLALNGQSAAALAAFEAGGRALQRDIGMQPVEETSRLADRIRHGELSPTTRRRGDAPSAPGQPHPERRQLSVLYCELRPTRPGEPEEMLDRLREPTVRSREAISAHAGYCLPVHGSGFLAYFGYPLALEQSAQLAVNAALALVRNMPSGITAHVGIETGIMLLGSDPRQPDATGLLSGLALRLSQSCAAGGVTIGAATHALVADRFECARLPPGEKPVPAFRVVGMAGGDTGAAGLAPLCGRRQELGLLRSLWQEARKGRQRSVLLRGEAGIGKARLVRTLQENLQRRGQRSWEMRCLAEHSQSPFQPLAALLGGLLGFAADDAPEARFDKLALFVEGSQLPAERAMVPLLAGLFGLPLRSPYLEPAGSASPQQRARMFAAAGALLAQLAGRRPMLLAVRDLQWADPSTLDFLQALIGQRQPYPLLVLLTARSDYHLAWEQMLDRQIELEALAETDIAALVAAIAPDADAQTVRRIVAHADGIPLYAEELARALRLGALVPVPASLHELLLARLDAAGQAKPVAQRAAVIGREFEIDLLQTISSFDHDFLVRQLCTMEEAGILQRISPAGYRFRHALMHDAAYHSLHRAEREEAHRRIAAALAASRGRVRPELLARHWAAGGDARQAIGCWLAAGKLASRHSACLEALLHFRAGLDLLRRQPDSAERNRLELDLQIGMGTAATAVQGYASAEAAAAYGRAQDLCAHDAAMDGMFPAVWGLWASASSRTGYPGALKIARKLHVMGENGGDPLERQQGNFAVANTLFWQGKFAAALPHLERVLGLYRLDHHARHVETFGEDAGVTARAYLSWTLWFFGRFDEARQASTEAVSLARRLGHPFSLAYALTFAALLHCRLREPVQALVLAEETLALADQHAFTLWKIGAMVARGWALAMQGRHAGLAALRDCVAGTRAAMGGVTLAVLEPIADACLLLGEAAQAGRHIAEALRVGAALGDHHADAELHRLRGAALLGLARPRRQEAAASFRQAIAISRRQQAQAPELRAAVGLARLLALQGKHREGYRLLAPLCGNFPEQCDNRDLAAARQLAEELRCVRG